MRQERMADCVEVVDIFLQTVYSSVSTERSGIDHEQLSGFRPPLLYLVPSLEDSIKSG